MSQPKGAGLNSSLLQVVIFFVALSLNLYPCTGHAASGDPDATFGTNGVVTTSVGGVDDVASSIGIQSDEKIVVAGSTSTGASYDFAVARYNNDGSMDTSFGTDGIVTTDIGGLNDNASALGIQSDGKIVVAGLSLTGISIVFGVVRYLSDGTLDVSFGGDGIVTTAITGVDDQPFALGIQSDGKIVVAGYTLIELVADFAVVRYNSDGSLDTSFDTDGIVTTAISAGHDKAFALGIQSDGKIVAAGFARIDATDDFAVVRYNSDGSLDTSFDTDGIVTTDIGGGDDQASAIKIQSDGKIVAAGFTGENPNQNFALVRYDSDGSQDTSFGGDGIVTTEISGSEDAKIYGLGIQSDGKIVAAGYAGFEATTGDDFAVARYSSNGNLDASFGDGGIVINDIGGQGDEFYGLGIQSDGKIVAAGAATVGTVKFAVGRYIGNTADIAVTEEASAASTAVGSNVTFTITVTNNGPDATSGVSVTDTLPSLLTFVSAEATQGTCSTEAPVTCDLGDLANGDTATVTLIATANAEGDVENTVSVTGQTFDPDTSNNSASVTVTVTAGGGGTADLGITKEASAASATVGENVTYTIVVTNNGPDATGGVSVTDTLSSLLTFVSAEATQGTCTAETSLTCSLGELANGATATVTVIATVNAAGDAGNTVSVTGQALDPDTSNNSASVTVTVTEANGGTNGETTASGGASCALSMHDHKQNGWTLALLFLPVFLLSVVHRPGQKPVTNR